MKIELRHGSGGEETGRLIHGIFEKYFSNPILNRMEDGAVLPVMEGNLVFTSDSFVVEPLFFPGGDIGRLSICGTVNDLASMGAKPLYLTASFILETGLETETLEKVAALAAWNSKGRESGKVDVDYTLIRYVKKIPNGPPGLVNYSHQKTIVAVPEDVKE